MMRLKEISLSCSCLKVACDMYSPPLEAVKQAFREAFPGYAVKAADWDDFRQKYLQVTNGLARQADYYRGLSAAERARVDHHLDHKRCGNCGARVLRSLLEEEEDAPSVFEILRRGGPPVTRCIEGLALPSA